MPFKLKSFFLKNEQKAFLFLMEKFALTQSQAQRAIAKKRVRINGEILTNGASFIKGEGSYVYFNPISHGLNPIFKTEFFVAYDKPSGVVMHPQSRTTEYSILDEAQATYGGAANITHRIDKETSGIVLVSLNKRSEKEIKSAFENRRVKKIYRALVHGQIEEPLFIDAPIGKSEGEIKVKMDIVQGAKSSQTTIVPIEYFKKENVTLVEAMPLTGRQHQIRVHLFHVKHPIVGDPLYGQNISDASKYLNRELRAKERVEKSGASRLMLNSQSIELELDKIYKIESKISILDEWIKW